MFDKMTDGPTLLSDGIQILIGFWNNYCISENPNLLLQGVPVVAKILGFGQEYYTDEEVNFLNNYVSECDRVLQPENLGFDFNNGQMWEDDNDIC